MIGKDISILASTPTERAAINAAFWSPSGPDWKALRRSKDANVPPYSLHGDHQAWGRAMREATWLPEAQARWLADGGELAWLPPYRPRSQS